VELLVVTDSQTIQKRMQHRGFLTLPSVDIKKELARARGPVLVYIDINSFGDTWEKTLVSLSRKDNVFFGILDPHSKIDYIPQRRLTEEPNEKSIKKVLGYLKKFRVDFSNIVSNEKKNPLQSFEYIPVLRGWHDIKSGNEYTFSILFVELDDQEEMEKRYGKKNLENALVVFQKYIERHVNALGGRIWIWGRFGGIVLFPFNSNECNSVLSGFRIVMYKYLHDVEESYFPNFISFRLALHLGNLVYQEHNKGEVVSDSINSVFHLGQKFAEPGNYYLTKEVFHYAPEPIKPYFKPVGTYEGRSIVRMRLPVL